MRNEQRWWVVCVLAGCLGWAPTVQAGAILGTGAGALLDGDLTDPDDNGAADADVNYDVVAFFGNEEPGFGGGEFAFNIFDNQVGGSNAKWCCGNQGGAPDFPDEPVFAGFELPVPVRLTHFTVTSGNDTPGRDPIDWSIEGSNDGTSWTTIFNQDASTQIWTARNQVFLFDAGDFAGQGVSGDFAVSLPFTHFRFITFDTVISAGGGGGANFQINEVEFFGVPIPEPTTSGLALLGMGALGLLRRRSVPAA